MSVDAAAIRHSPIENPGEVALFTSARSAGPAQRDTFTTSDFLAYMPAHSYIFVPSREMWPAVSVNARCQPPKNSDGTAATKQVPRERNGKVEFKDAPMAPAEWLDKNRPVDQMTWAPGEPMLIRDRLTSGGGWIERPGCTVFNQYLPPQRPKGDPAAAGPWIDHLRQIYPGEAQHIARWLAHRVQRPGEKINHALVLGGEPGIGKDTILEPVKHAVGPWNMAEVSPATLLGRFNGFVKSVILRVSEARDLGDVDRYALYEHMKAYLAAPPDVLRCDEKNLREYSVMNVMGVVITTNHKSDGIYLPPDDRRHFVAWSEAKRANFAADHWIKFYRWYAEGGIGHVGAYLASLDLTGFDPKAPPPKTEAFHAIVNANRAAEDAEIQDCLDAMRQPQPDGPRPQAIRIADLTVYASESFRDWLDDRKNRRVIPHRLETCGYVPVRNPAAADGLWRVQGRRQALYAGRDLSLRDQLGAAQALTGVP